MSNTIRIALVPGDGSGPEMMAQACRIAEKAAEVEDAVIEWVETPMGWCALEDFDDTFPADSFAMASEIGTIFFGGVGDPEYDKTIGLERPELKPEPRCLLPIRKEWLLDVNARPFTFYPELKHLSSLRPDLIPDHETCWYFLRFLLEDTYFGTVDLGARISGVPIIAKSDVTGKEDMVVDIAYYRRESLLNYFRYAFALARSKSLPIICIDKANVSARYQFWREIFKEVAIENTDIEVKNYFFVDAANSFLARPEILHGIIVCGNEHGDILSDGAASFHGGMGLMHSSAISSDPNNTKAMFESGAGTAPTLKGQNIVNPLGRILTAGLMFDHLGLKSAAAAIPVAVQEVLKEGWRTADLATAIDPKEMILGTKEVADKVIEHLEVA